jgi:myo-inositol-1(or 4)-monophosphatase
MKEAYQKVQELILDAGRKTVEHGRSLVADIKADGSYQTNVDRMLEKEFQEVLLKLFPDDCILGEEFGLIGERAEDCGIWFVDPVDGTEAYYTGFPTYAVSLARYVNGKCDYSALYLPCSAMLFEYVENTVLLNGDSCSALYPPRTDALFVPSHFYKEYCLRANRKIRSLGSTCFHLAYVLLGMVEGALITRANLWDIASVYPMLKANGICLKTFDGKDIEPDFQGEDCTLSEAFIVCPEQSFTKLTNEIEPGLSSSSGFFTGI